ncbi:SRPBCC domain-containing protein [uncultured Maricaulis sp.]|uniref:SRPBCC family protein n=1 Tax=uncultured Maricaulis sp. TaxID=174710 RepID=UPI0030DA5C4D|tara:strand:+ start:287216 stop:287722 length:507 start_codon:yes stop_codon:yes gene_type:complete
MTDQPKYILDRVFDAPREMVWQAWTDPELLARWYGPGVETIIHKFDLKPGGLWLNEMKWGENSMLSKVVFKEVTPPRRLVWHHHSLTDSDWNSIANPKMPDWPRILLTEVKFEVDGSRTRVRLTWVPFEASEAERACFAGAVNHMGKGWESGYAIMDELLAELKAVRS